MNKIGAVKTPLFLTRASKNSPLQVGDELQKKKTEHLFCNAKCGIL